MTCTIIDKVRSPKILDMAIFDWSATLLVGFILTLIIYYFSRVNFIILLILISCSLIFSGVVVHKLLGIPTMFNYYLGLNSKESVLKNRKDC